MEDIKIAVIDTDIDINCTELNLSTIDIDNRFWIDGLAPSAYPKGHGTAVCGIIQKYAPHAKIILFPVSSNDDSSILIGILNYIYENKICNVINLSLGFFATGEKNEELRIICEKLYAAGIIIISAYDNQGFMSYPACFGEVIGIDTSKDVKGDDFIWVENSPINIICSSEKKRVIWEGGNKVFVKGNSFSVPFISSIVACILKTERRIYDIKNLLKRKAVSVRKITSTFQNNENKVTVNKAILFPINDDTLPIVAYKNDCQFELVDVYDYMYSNKIGKKVSEYFSFINDGDYCIESFDAIKWDDDFDTILLGRINDVQSSLQHDIINDLVNKAEKYKKAIYLLDDNVFDRINRKKDILIPPTNPMNQYPSTLLNKKWKNSTFTICIAGSGLDIDKLMLQLQLKRIISSEGYSVGYLSTHKSGQILGADQTFTYNKNQFDVINEKDKSLLLNNLIHEIELKNPDIIITGMLSEMIPSNILLPSSVVFTQSTFLYTVQPNVIVLVVSLDDKVEYIIRNIDFIKSTIEKDEICIAVSPIKTSYKNGLTSAKNISGSIKLLSFIEILKEKTGLPTVELNEKNMIQIKDICMDRVKRVLS